MVILGVDCICLGASRGHRNELVRKPCTTRAIIHVPGAQPTGCSFARCASSTASLPRANAASAASAASAQRRLDSVKRELSRRESSSSVTAASEPA